MDDTRSTSEESGTFRAVLHAHRSLSPTGFLILMCALGGVSFVAGMAFVLMGAWPVMGFFGLDVLLVYLAFRLNYRSAQAHEIVALTPQELTVTRVAANGTQQRFAFNPYWVRVNLAERVDGRTDLMLTSHGQDFSFGRQLNDVERRDFAGALRTALSRTRAVTEF